MLSRTRGSGRSRVASALGLTKDFPLVPCWSAPLHRGLRRGSRAGVVGRPVRGHPARRHYLFLIGTINLIVLSSPGTISMFTPACVDCPLVRLVGRFCQYTYPGGPAFARTITVAKPNTVAIRMTAAIAF